MRLPGLLVLILSISRIEGIYECCPGENVLSLVTKKCSTNQSISVECNGHLINVNASRFMEDNYLLLENETLIEKNSRSEITYCHSNPDIDSVNISNHIYIICYIPIEDPMEEHRIELVATLGYISVAFTILTIIVYVMVPKLLDLQGICTLHALTGLAAGYTFLGVIQLCTLNPSSCQVVAFLTYFSLLYLFFWLNTLSFHIWRTTVYPEFSTLTKWSVVYHVFAIGGTTFFLIFALLAHHAPAPIWDNIRPGIGEGTCWFKSMRETMIFFYGPIMCLLLLNIVFYLWTIINLWKKAENTKTKILKYRLNLCVRLCVIMGITWVFEIITAVFKDPEMSYSGKVIFFILDLCNILQGFFIFLVLVVFRKKVRRALASKNLCNIQFPNSWKYLEDEEMESIEYRLNSTAAQYKEDNVEIKI